MAQKLGYFRAGKYVWNSYSSTDNKLEVLLKISGKIDGKIGDALVSGNGSVSFVGTNDSNQNNRSLPNSKGMMQAGTPLIKGAVNFASIGPSNGAATFKASGAAPQSTALAGTTASESLSSPEATVIDENQSGYNIGGIAQGPVSGSQTARCDMCELARVAGGDPDVALTRTELYQMVDEMWDRSGTQTCVSAYDEFGPESSGCGCNDSKCDGTS